MTKRILCAIDLNHENHDEVLTIANKLALIDEASLDVVTVVPTLGPSLVGSYFKENFQKEAVSETRKVLDERVNKVLGEQRNKEIRHVVASGSVYDEILSVAKKIKCDLIVIGAHKPGLREYLLGTNATLIVRHSACSVYVVRE